MKISCYPSGVPQAGDKFVFERTVGTPGDFNIDWSAIQAAIDAANPKVASVAFNQELGVSLPTATVATAPADGLYLLSWTFVSLGVVGTSAFHFSWTDPSGTVNALDAFYPGDPFPAAVQLKAGTQVTASTAVNPAQPAYTLNVTLTRLG
jgi:hypothetical protein